MISSAALLYGGSDWTAAPLPAALGSNTIDWAEAVLEAYIKATTSTPTCAYFWLAKIFLIHVMLSYL